MTRYIHKASFVRNYKNARLTGSMPKQAFAYAQAMDANVYIAGQQCIYNVK